MPALLRAKFNYVILLPAILALLLGGTVLFGWVSDIPALTRINPRWNPMVPGTALCFILGGLALLSCRTFSGQPASVVQRILSLLILLLAGTRTVELVSGREWGVEFLATALAGQVRPIGHMSPLTVLGFLMFAIGILANQRANGPKFLMLARTLAGALLTLGLGVAIGYWLNLRMYFESEYLATGLVWMSLPTAIGMTLLGAGLWGVLLRGRQDTETTTPDRRAAQLYRATIIALAATSIATGTAGLVFLDRTVVSQAGSSMAQLLESRRDFIRTSLDNRMQRALVASSEPALQAAAITLPGETKSTLAMAPATDYARSLLAHGFSGIGLEQGRRRRVIAGRLLPDTVAFVRLKGETMLLLPGTRAITCGCAFPWAAARLAIKRRAFWCSNSPYPGWMNFSMRPIAGGRRAACRCAPAGTRQVCCVSPSVNKAACTWSRTASREIRPRCLTRWPIKSALNH